MSGLFDHIENGNLDADPRAPFVDAAATLKFMRGGKATVTLVSKKTGTRFTYRVNVSDDSNCYFVGLLTGPDNFADYKYIGRIASLTLGGIFYAGRKVPRPGDIAYDAPSVRAFDWAWQQLVRGAMPESLEVWHEGQCGRCGRKLTVPELIASGFGPECRGKV